MSKSFLKLFTIEPHTTIDKSFEVRGPDDFTLKVDYDDVDHKAVDAATKKMVAILNLYWAPFG